MRTLLFGVILGLLSIVHSTPIDGVTQIPAKAEDEVFREALNDGFLVDQNSLSLLTTDPPKRNTTTQASEQQPGSTDGHMMEESGTLETNSEIGKSSDTTTLSVSNAQDSHLSTKSPKITLSSQHTTEPYEAKDSEHKYEEVPSDQTTASSTMPHPSSTAPMVLATNSLDSSPTQSPKPASSSSTVENEANSRVTQTHTTVFQTTDLDSGSGNGEGFDTAIRSSSTVPMDTTTESSDATESTSSITPDHTTVSEATESYSSGFGVEEEFGQTTSSSPRPTTHSSDTSTLPHHDVTSSSVPKSSPTPNFSTEDSYSGSGSEETTSTTEMSTALHLAIERFEVNLPLMNTGEVHNPVPTSSPGHKTPGWMIILGFIVGLGAVVMILAAIATRHRWNAPPAQQSDPETKADSTHQQREIEMETFLPHEPKENGKAGEYTVIPLEELPENYSSH